MRILCILDNLSIASGVSSIVMNLYLNMDVEKIQMDFLVCNKQQESFEKEINEYGGKVFYMGNFLSPYQAISAIKNSKTFFEKYGSNYDVVHLHTPTIAMFTLKYAKTCGVPARIVHSHSTMMSVSKLKNIINKYLIAQIKKYANVFCACSTEAAHFLYGKNFCETHQIELMHNAVDCTKFIFNQEIANMIRENLEIDGYKVFIHVSNYSPIKNHVFLLDVIERFKTYEKKVKFIFVGNGPTRQSFEREIEKRVLQQFCVFIDKTPDVAKYMFAADAVILPSLKEGLPVTLVEAQATGLPFFTSDAVTREVNVGKGEFIPLITEKWFEQLNAFEPLSVEERAEHSERFRQSVFNIKIEAARVASFYEELTQGGRKV